MQHRKLGQTDLTFSVTGFGTWAIGGSGWQWSWGAQDDDASIRAIRHALDCGVNWIDTAAVYGAGHSEEVVGRAIRELAEKPLIATKGGRLLRDDGTVYGHLKRDSIRREVETSLRRLGVDVIDLYQIHWPQPDEDIEEAWETVAALVDEGKIRYAGVSNFSAGQIERLRGIHPVASLQPQYNMLVRAFEHDLLDYCGRNGIGIIVYSPMMKGLLTGAITPERMASLPHDDHRRRDPRFNEPQLSQILALLDRLRPIAERNGCTLAQLAIAWTLRHPEVTAAIVGSRKPSQIDETAAAGDRTIAPGDIASIDILLDEFAKNS